MPLKCPSWYCRICTWTHEANTRSADLNCCCWCEKHDYIRAKKAAILAYHSRGGAGGGTRRRPPPDGSWSKPPPRDVSVSASASVSVKDAIEVIGRAIPPDSRGILEQLDQLTEEPSPPPLTNVDRASERAKVAQRHHQALINKSQCDKDIFVAKQQLETLEAKSRELEQSIADLSSQLDTFTNENLMEFDPLKKDTPIESAFKDLSQWASSVSGDLTKEDFITALLGKLGTPLHPHPSPNVSPFTFSGSGTSSATFGGPSGPVASPFISGSTPLPNVQQQQQQLQPQHPQQQHQQQQLQQQNVGGSFASSSGTSGSLGIIPLFPQVPSHPLSHDPSPAQATLTPVPSSPPNQVSPDFSHLDLLYDHGYTNLPPAAAATTTGGAFPPRASPSARTHPYPSCG